MYLVCKIRLPLGKIRMVPFCIRRTIVDKITGRLLKKPRAHVIYVVYVRFLMGKIRVLITAREQNSEFKLIYLGDRKAKALFRPNCIHELQRNISPRVSPSP